MRIPAFLLCGLLLVLVALLAFRPGTSRERAEPLQPRAGAAAGSSTGGAPRLEERGAGAGSTAAGATRRATATSFSGSAEHWLSGEAVAGASFVFSAGGRSVELHSEADGGFEVELAPSELSAVEVRAPAGLWTLEHGFDERAEVPHYRARFAPDSLGPFHARLVDRYTQAALPDFVVRIRGAEAWSETVRTNENGVLRTRTLFSAGILQLLSSEEESGDGLGGWTLALREFTPAGARPPLVTLALESGPTYTLLLDKPAELELHSLRAFLVDCSWANDVGGQNDIGISLRPGPPVWVRFPRDASWIEEACLVVSGPGGRWRGTAQVNPAPGRHAEPIALRVTAMGRLRGRVYDANGEGVARAELQLDSAGMDGRGFGRWTWSNGRGNFSFEGLPAGPYTLSIQHVTKGTLTTPVDVVVEDERRASFVLDPMAIGGDVEGLVRSASGEFQSQARISLIALPSQQGKSPPARYQRLVWKLEGSEFVARFKFIGVADARYKLALLTPRQPYSTSPEELEVAPPAAGAELVVQDDREVFYLFFQTLDGASGDWLAGVHLQLIGAGGEELYDGPARGWRTQQPFAEDERISWELSLEGYVTARGDRSAFRGRWGNKTRFARVELQRN